MNNKAIKFIKNFSYTLISNLTSLLVSVVIVLIVPKLIGVEEYGYWQLYLFYSSYVGFLHFGWNDGIYLRYGGKEYDELDKRVFFSQFYMLFIMQLVIGAIIFCMSCIFIIEMDKVFIFQMTALCLLIVNVRYMLLYILQGTNRIKEYAQITMMDKVLYCLLIIIFLIFGERQYKMMIIADLIGKFISLLYAMFYCKDIVFGKIDTFYFSFRETKENINVGIKLMFSTIASMLIIGVIRFGIEHSWNVETFGKVSLTLNISNLIMVFINSLGIVMFPKLKRTDEKKLPSIYTTVRTILMILLLGILILYYPLKFGLSLWLPQYKESLLYMAVVFPISIYEGKMSLLINTYVKTLRKEKMILKINFTTLVLSAIISIISTLVLKNLDLAIVSIVICLAFRCVFAEITLAKILRISILKDIILELTLTILFILTGWFIIPWIGAIIYTIAYVIYVIIKRKEITIIINSMNMIISA